MGADEEKAAGRGERDPPWIATLPSAAPDGVSPARTGGGRGVRLAGRERTDGERERGDRRARTGDGEWETGKRRGRGWRSLVCGRQPRAQAGHRSARGARAGERQVQAAVRGTGAAGGGARRGRRTGKPRAAGPAVGRGEARPGPIAVRAVGPLERGRPPPRDLELPDDDVHRASHGHSL